MAPGDGLSRRQALIGAAAASLLGRDALALPARERLRGLEGPPADFTLSGATLQLHDGTVLSPAGLRVEGGRIVELGQGVRGGEDLGGAWLCPGLVDAGNSIGLVEILQEGGTRDDEPGASVNPDLRVVDAFNPLSELQAVARSGGVLHALVLPASNRLVSGQAALMRMWGLTVAEATVQAPVGLCVGLGSAGLGGEGAPKNRMEIAARLRELLEAAEEPGDKEKEAAPRSRRRARDEAKADRPGAPGPSKEDDKTPAQRVWDDVRAGRLRLLVTAQRADDILTALRLRDQFGLSMVLQGAAEAWVVADELAKAGVGVLLGPVDTQPDSFEQRLARPDNALALHRAGVPFALRTTSAHNARLLSTTAGVAVAHGLPRAAAIPAITAAAGQILGIEGVGRLEVGGPATFFQCQGDPLQPRFAIPRAWADGQPLRMDNRQTRLYERYRALR